MSIDFRVLGTLEVSADSKLLDLSSPRQRIVLLLLLFQVNWAVPADRLVEALWDEDPPATAKSQVQNCISALRSQLRGIGADSMISTVANGYMIRLPDDALDVTRFEQLTSQGRAKAAELRIDEAVLDLRAALDLWRGPAASGVESRLVQSMAVRLNEDRLNVLEECIELELSLCKHRHLAGELTELVRQHPLRERLRAHHMLALYRSGRQADALESFQEARQILMEELGLEPGQELCALQRSILAQSPALDLSPDTVGTTWADGGGASTPRQLPTEISDFTGREKLASELTEVLSVSDGPSGLPRYQPVAFLTGMGGVGKTALAVHVAHAVRHTFHDGQLFIQLHEPDGQPITSSEVLGRFLRALGLPAIGIPDEPAERAALYRTWLADRRVLVVLDDADSVAQVTPLIPGGRGCAVIITSRNSLPGLNGAHYYDVEDLDEEASVRILTQVVGAERVEAEASAAQTLVRLCGRLPLALHIAAAKLAARTHWKIEQMVLRLTDDAKRLDELHVGGIGIRATLSLSYDTLPDEARQLFRRLGMLGTSDFASWVTSPLMDADAEVAAEVLETLVDAHLVEVRVPENGGPRFRLHDLVHIFAIERLSAEEDTLERAAAHERLLRCWLSLASEAHRRAYDGNFGVLHADVPPWQLRDDVVDRLLAQPLTWFRTEHSGLVSAVMRAGRAGLDELCWDLALTSVTLFESEYQIEDWQNTHQLALDATRRAGNRRGEAAILYSLGNLAVTRHLSEASSYLEPALGIFEQLDEAHGRALTLGALAFVDRMSGKYERALSRYQDALRLFRDVGDLVGEADVLSNVAQIQMDLEQFSEAGQLLHQARAVCRSMKAPRVTAQTEYRIGEYFLRIGDLERAAGSFDQALRIGRQTGDLVGEAYALLGRGTVRARQGWYTQAENDLNAALASARHMSDNLVHGRVLLAFAEFYLSENQLVRADALINEALVVFSELGPAAIWRARFLQLKAQVDKLSGHPAAGAAALREARNQLTGADPSLLRILGGEAQKPEDGADDLGG